MQFAADVSAQQGVFLLDAGAEASFVDVGFAKQHGLICRAVLHVGLVPTGHTVNMADGTPIHVYGVLCLSLSLSV